MMRHFLFGWQKSLMSDPVGNWGRNEFKETWGRHLT